MSHTVQSAAGDDFTGGDRATQVRPFEPVCWPVPR